MFRHRDLTPAPWMRRGLVMMLLLTAFGFMTYNAVAQSPTMDEQNHIARGYALLRTGDPRLSVEHPPLINLLESLLLGQGVNLPLDHESWAHGDWYRFANLLFWERNSMQGRMVFLARMPVVGLTVLLGALVSRWGRELGGRYAALMAPALALLDPNLLAHGSLATTDLGISFTVLLAAYGVWHASAALANARRHPRRVPFMLSAAGFALGLMLGSKTSAVLFWGVFGVLFVLDAGRSPWRTEWRQRFVGRGVAYFGMTLVALLVLWAGYGFDVAPVTEQGLRLPLGTYWRGLRIVLGNVQSGRPSYLLGETRLGGWLLYFPIAFVVKTPLPVLLLLVSAVALQSPQTDRRATWYLLLPVAAYGLAALRSDLNIGYRHLLPILPLLFVWTAVRFERAQRPRWRWLGAAMAIWLCVVTIWMAPHFLAYFNAIGGGPSQGWRVLADANIDWGQDLKYLRNYLDREMPGKVVKLSWFGTSPPDQYGIAYEPLPGLPHHFDMWFEPPTFDEMQPEPGVYVISVSNLVELPLVDKHFFAYFRQREPDARIGYSIYVYEVEGL